MWEAAYIGNNQQKFKNNGWSFYLLRLLRNGQKSDSCAAHFGQQFNAFTPDTDLCKYITFIVVKQLNPIGAMKKLQSLTAIYVRRSV